ncbi:MAG: 4Fe-4S binding protein [Mangrovibacterium sp.]
MKSSKFISLDTNKCIACWKCVDACERKVIGKVAILWHKHIVLRNLDNCLGCGKCIKACPQGVISKVPKNQS